MTDLETLGKQAKIASQTLALATTQQKNQMLQILAEQLRKQTATILTANEKDLGKAKEKGMSDIMMDRLRLSAERIEDMAQGVEQVIQLTDPIGEVTHMWQNEAGLTIGKSRVPLGVIGMIYESRPNVTIDAAILCFKAGNAVILRSGSEAFYSSQALVQVIQTALTETGFPIHSVQLIEDTSHEIVQKFMRLNDYLDVLIPRGSARLIQTVLKNATVPVIETGTGNNHIYVDQAAQLKMATDIIVNAKCSRPSVCNAAETLLIHHDVAATFLPVIEEALVAYHVELRADEQAIKYLKHAVPASEEDFSTEFLDYILAVKVVDSIDAAIDHINHYGTGHSEAIVTDNYFAGKKFQQAVDAAAVYINASTRFTDGFEFGFGAEIGISTQKLHARGPMGLNELTSTKYIIFGEGQIRE